MIIKKSNIQNSKVQTYQSYYHEDCILLTGTYAPLGSVQCLMCPEGAACPNTATVESCVEGEYSGYGDHMCHTCPSGSYCPGGAAMPTICPEGFYSNNGSALCSLCPAGKKPFVDYALVTLFYCLDFRSHVS